jgi:trehalose 6-phosphate phosphatase
VTAGAAIINPVLAEPPKPHSDPALFLDFDGTLVDIAPSPRDVIVTPELLNLIGQMQQAFAGAVALVSGRPIADLDALLQPLEFAAVGEHGAQLRLANTREIISELQFPAAGRQAAIQLAESLAGTELELKQASVSLHYRQVPECAADVIAGMEALALGMDGYALMQGKMVAELKPTHINKGQAIRELYAAQPFAGRQPVFVGDDVTDEPGFAAVNELGGLSIRVGSAATTAAHYQLSNVDAVHQWLTGLV